LSGERIAAANPRHDTCCATRLSEALHPQETPSMTLTTIVLIVLILLLIGSVPAWPYSRGWGYYPSGGLGLLLIILLVLFLLGVF
jgi:hypothetical protein